MLRWAFIFLLPWIIGFVLFQAGNGRDPSSAATLADDSNPQGETPE